MKKVTYYLSLLVILLAVQALAEKPKGGLLIVEGPYQVSLGDFPAEQIKTVAFKLKNVGDAPIGIASVSRACGCADAFMTTNVVDRGASVGITFKTYPDKLPGTFVKTFYVITDSPDSRTKLVQLVVTGNGIVTKGKATNGVAVAAAGEQVNNVVGIVEWWNDGILGKQNTGYGRDGGLAVRASRPMPLPNMASASIPVFHHSIIPVTSNQFVYSQQSFGYRLDVEFFVQEGCAECLLLRRDYLPALANRYAYRVRTVVSDTHSISTFLRLLEKLEACGVKANEPVYMVVGGKKVLSGWGEIEKRGFGAIDKALSAGSLEPQNPSTFANTPTADRQNITKKHLCVLASSQAPSEAGEAPAKSLCGSPQSRPPACGAALNTEENAAARLFRRFGWPAVAIAGLADGLNPCAFATIVFLTSILASGGRRGRAVFMGGLAFCVASFVTYFLIGFGLLSALRRLEGLAVLRFIVEWGTVSALMILGALSLLDAWRYSRTGDAGSVSLQLPAGVKRRIRVFAHKRWGGAAVFGTGLLCGAGITLLESVCTGQMYLPTLVFMSREGGGCRAWGMLLLYNVLFVVPLFAVFMLGAFGVRSQRMAVLTRHHVVPSKILLAVVFLSLAAFLLSYALVHT